MEEIVGRTERGGGRGTWSDRGKAQGSDVWREGSAELMEAIERQEQLLCFEFEYPSNSKPKKKNIQSIN